MPRQSLFTSPKFRRLCQLLGMPRPHVLGHLEFLWRVAYDQVSPKIGTATAVELAAEWEGEPGAFADALRDCGKDLGKGGFILHKGAGVYEIHDFIDHAPDYAKKRILRKMERDSANTPKNNDANSIGTRGEKTPEESKYLDDGGGQRRTAVTERRTTADREEKRREEKREEERREDTREVGDGEKKDDPGSPPPKEDTTGLFHKFYEAYPKPDNLTDTAFEWNKIPPLDRQRVLDLSLADIKRRLNSGEWDLEKKNFIPTPANYLRKARYLDAPPKKKKAAPRPTTPPPAQKPPENTPEDKEAAKAALAAIGAATGVNLGRSASEKGPDEHDRREELRSQAATLTAIEGGAR